MNGQPNVRPVLLTDAQVDRLCAGERLEELKSTQIVRATRAQAARLRHAGLLGKPVPIPGCVDEFHAVGNAPTGAELQAQRREWQEALEAMPEDSRRALNEHLLRTALLHSDMYEGPGFHLTDEQVDRWIETGRPPAEIPEGQTFSTTHEQGARLRAAGIGGNPAPPDHGESA